ncbi:hypothetical protein PENTCL1PPCAC_16374, partial [Pristionchus entomophagus]
VAAAMAAEVYRAPPSLVAPYNRLAYGGKLVSKKAEGESPLSRPGMGLIPSGRPQLLLIDVDGMQETNEKTKSLYNEKELEVVCRLLKKVPRAWAKGIMIICLYKDQKKSLQRILDYHHMLEGKEKRRQQSYDHRRDSQPSLDKQYTVLTVDSAQGKEKPIVILLTTRLLLQQREMQRRHFSSVEGPDHPGKGLSPHLECTMEYGSE